MQLFRIADVSSDSPHPMSRPQLCRSLKLLVGFIVAFSQSLAATTDDTALIQRAEKIVAGLELSDPQTALRMRDIVADHYAALRKIHEARDSTVTQAEQIADQRERATAVQTARDTATARQAELHFAFTARLAAELTPVQVEHIKNGMTYGVLPNTLKVYQEMLPDLSAEQRTQIVAWLTEAREHAMSAGSSHEKHAWFGKYKGRINNYLSKYGYDMKQAERDMFARQKATVPDKITP